VNSLSSPLFVLRLALLLLSKMEESKKAKKSKKSVDAAPIEEEEELDIRTPKDIKVTIRGSTSSPTSSSTKLPGSRPMSREAWAAAPSLPPSKSLGLRLWEGLRLASLVVAVKYVFSDSKKNRRAWFIGFFTVFLVVTFTTILQNAIAKSPIIFMKLAEDQVGEYDLLLTGQSTANSFQFWTNYTDIEDKVSSGSLVRGATPRWVVIGRVLNPLQTSLNSSSAFLIIDSEREREIGLGREWDHPDLNSLEVHVTASLLRLLQIEPNQGQSILLQLDIFKLAQDFGVFQGKTAEEWIKGQIKDRMTSGDSGINWDNTTLGEILDSIPPDGPAGNITAFLRQLLGDNLDLNLSLNQLLDQIIPQILQAGRLSREFLVIDGIEKSNGKYPSALGNVALFDSAEISGFVEVLISQMRALGLFPQIDILRSLVPLLPPQYQEDVNQILDQLDSWTSMLDNFQQSFQVNDYALTTIIMYKERLSTYVKNQDGLNKGVIQFTNQVADKLGYDYPVTFSLPLADALAPLYFLRLFLDQIFTFVVVVLIVLGALLIYSLLLSNVEERHMNTACCEDWECNTSY